MITENVCVSSIQVHLPSQLSMSPFQQIVVLSLNDQSHSALINQLKKKTWSEKKRDVHVISMELLEWMFECSINISIT